ncbi:MAG: hypothetical protein HY908_22985 [Myxococcales bacterium]|nr:hypothetical protein [Myxococcales bacterium]
MLTRCLPGLVRSSCAQGLRVLAVVALGLGLLGVGARPAAADGNPPPLPGKSYDYAYDGADVQHPERAWLGRVFVHERVAATPERPVPLLVFLHGTNKDLVPYRWMDSGDDGDLRRIVGRLVDAGKIEPVLVATPSSVVESAISQAYNAWPRFDLDNFVARTAERLKGIATIDLSRVIVAGHSGAGCNLKGGLVTATQAKNHPFAALSIDTCQRPDIARHLVRLPVETKVIVTWQDMTWPSRALEDFETAFKHARKRAAFPPGTVRTLDHMMPRGNNPHDSMVQTTLAKYLPVLVPPSPSGGAATVAAAR